MSTCSLFVKSIKEKIVDKRGTSLDETSRKGVRVIPNRPRPTRRLVASVDPNTSVVYMNRLFLSSFVTNKDGGGDVPSGPPGSGPALLGLFIILQFC